MFTMAPPPFSLLAGKMTPRWQLPGPGTFTPVTTLFQPATDLTTALSAQWSPYQLWGTTTRPPLSPGPQLQPPPGIQAAQTQCYQLYWTAHCHPPLNHHQQQRHPPPTQLRKCQPWPPPHPCHSHHHRLKRISAATATEVANRHGACNCNAAAATKVATASTTTNFNISTVHPTQLQQIQETFISL